MYLRIFSCTGREGWSPSFTFEGRKMRADILEGLEAGNLKFLTAKLQITFTPRMNRYTKQDRSTIDPMIDPRYWMRGAELFYLEKSLGEHLEQRPSRITSSGDTRRDVVLYCRCVQSSRTTYGISGLHRKWGFVY